MAANSLFSVKSPKTDRSGSVKFHVRCGTNVKVKERGQMADRRGFQFGYNAVLTCSPLKTSELWQVKLSKIDGERGWLSFGVTLHSPDKIVFPMFMADLMGAWMFKGTTSGGHIVVNGQKEKEKFVTSTEGIAALKKGDELGLMVTPDQSLVFFLNGRELGVAATDIPQGVYGFVDLWGQCGAVRIVKNQHLSSPEIDQKLHHQLQVSTLTTQLDGNNSEMEQQKYRELEKVKATLQSQLDERNSEIEQLRKELATQQSTIHQLHQQQEEDNHQMKQQLSVASETIQQLRQQVKQQATPQSHLTEFWEVPRKEVTLNTQRILGTGGWGYVVEGTFRGQTVAVKCLHDLIREPEFIAVIRREIGIMAQIRHPNLVLLIAAVIDEESDPLVITELLDMSLRKAYEKKRLEGSSKLSIYRDIACALNYLHLHHHGPIIHRDVSSANVLLEAKPNNQWKAKLSDFGSAKLAREATTTGPGAPVYAAPEVRTQTGIPQSAKVDVYSYGILLCEVTAGRFPTETRFPEMLQTVKETWSFMHTLITTCIQKHPDNRPTMASILHKVNSQLHVL